MLFPNPTLRMKKSNLLKYRINIFFNLFHIFQCYLTTSNALLFKLVLEQIIYSIFIVSLNNEILKIII